MEAEVNHKVEGAKVLERGVCLRRQRGMFVVIVPTVLYGCEAWAERCLWCEKKWMVRVLKCILCLVREKE